MHRALSFNHLSHCQHAILEGIPGTIAQKCKGLPLAANLMGHLLSSKRSEDEWVNLSERDICELPVFKEEIFPTFRLNDPDLGYHLKKCLAYCSLFPSNYDFNQDTLVRLWIAEGFILPQGMTNLGEIGNEYFDGLLMRSIFQLSGIVDNEWQAYKMHEFIHRFAESVASDVYLRREEGKCSSSTPLHKKARHLSLIYNTIKKLFLKHIEKCEGLRTFLVLGEHGTKIGQVPYSLFQKLLRLRVLDLSNTDVDELPESIGRLRHLRYLDISRTHVKMLPESTSELHMLQVLKLRECFGLLELPNNTKNLSNLVHLDVDIKGLWSMPPGLGSLTCLQTLPGFIVGKKEGNRIAELKNLNSLQGTICISNIGNIKNREEAKEARLYEKKYMRRLELEWKRYSKDAIIAMEVLAGLQPHDNTKELQVTNYAGSSFPDWLTSQSCMLESLHLHKCRQHDVLPSLGQLQFLKTLHLEAMHDVKCVDDSFCGESTSGAFPSLEYLKIQDMMCLNRWDKLPDNSMQELRELTIEDCPSLHYVQPLRGMRSLQKLEIIRCPELKGLPVLPSSLVSLFVIECDTLKQRCQPQGPDWYLIKSIPYVEIDFSEVSFPGCSS